MDKNKPKRDRTHEVKVRLSDDELRMLNGKFKATNLRSREQFIRRLIIDADIYEVDYRHLIDFNYQISRLGHNVDQILKRVNIEKTGIIYERQINEIKEALETVWQLQRSMYSVQCPLFLLFMSVKTKNCHRPANGLQQFRCFVILKCFIRDPLYQSTAERTSEN